MKLHFRILPLLRSVVFYLFAILLVLLITLTALYAPLRNNIHPVIPGQVYRTAQLQPKRLQHLIVDRNIRSIINLRGASPREIWYIRERQVAKKLSVSLIDFRLKAYVFPTGDQLRKIVDHIENAQRPVVLHCEGGADRSGFAAAIVLLLRGRSLELAKQQTSLYYHVISPKSIGRQLVDQYQGWLKRRGYPQSTRDLFLDWVWQYEKPYIDQSEIGDFEVPDDRIRIR